MRNKIKQFKTIIKILLPTKSVDELKFLSVNRL